MSQDPNQPPQPYWDAQQGRWVLPDQRSQPAGQQGFGQQGYGQPGYGQGYGQQMSRHGQPDQPPGQWSGQPSSPTPTPKRRKWPWIVGGIVLLIIIISLTSKGGTNNTASTGAAAPTTQAPAAGQQPSASAAPDSSAAGSGTVVYEVTGSGRANNITYGDVTKGLSQQNGTKLPWKKSAPASEGFAAYGLTAQNGGSGEISCKITVDGKEVANNTSTGQYAVVSCNGNTSPF